jgi:hypothetical protein
MHVYLRVYLRVCNCVPAPLRVTCLRAPALRLAMRVLRMRVLRWIDLCNIFPSNFYHYLLFWFAPKSICRCWCLRCVLCGCNRVINVAESDINVTSFKCHSDTPIVPQFSFIHTAYLRTTFVSLCSLLVFLLDLQFEGSGYKIILDLLQPTTKWRRKWVCTTRALTAFLPSMFLLPLKTHTSPLPLYLCTIISPEITKRHILTPHHDREENSALCWAKVEWQTFSLIHRSCWLFSESRKVHYTVFLLCNLIYAWVIQDSKLGNRLWRFFTSWLQRIYVSL